MAKEKKNTLKEATELLERRKFLLMCLTEMRDVLSHSDVNIKEMSAMDLIDAIKVRQEFTAAKIDEYLAATNQEEV